VEILFIGPFGLHPKYTVSGRALPLAQALARRGHHIRLLIPPWDHPADSGQRVVIDGVQVEQIQLPPHVPAVEHGLIVWRLLRSAFTSGADVIHVFKPKGYSGVVALVLWCLKRLGIIHARLVVDTDDWEGPGGWNDRGEYNLLARRIFAWQERWGLAHCDAVTGASHTLQSLARSLAPRGRPVCYVPNGLLDLPDLPPRELARSQLNLGDGPVILIYTRFVEIGPEHLGSIVAALLKRLADTYILVVGEGLSDELERFRDCLVGMGSRACLPSWWDRVRLVGWVERADLPCYWSAADLALFPCEDNLLTRSKSPLRLVEMMAAGLPIIAHGVGEAEHYLEHRTSGILISPGNDQEFIEAASELALSPGLRRYLGERARRRVQHDFNWRHLVERVEAVYTDITGLREL